MTPRLFLLCFLLSLVLFPGCGGGKKPAGFPDLIRPVAVKVHKDGQPISGVTVILHTKDPAAGFRFTGLQTSGKTGADGVATLETSHSSYTASGVPAGTYRVQLVETLNIDIRELSLEASGAEVAAWRKEYDEKAEKLRSVPKTLNSTDNSPLEMDINTSGTIEFDVAKY